ncbi:hypothetical protein KEM60_01241 [Austwickia sp. TVS 96-490-7B]|uniref:methyl-accepting chemotaxis protein n=1 Tax=Austwickia sp. TVS 96-490-7B TaxID=2830843 RepID=UPI001C57DA83|nr:methyl-accepting chemotaxis protein [Austwickia sp. TVS 96-490-7B]MBW3085049.1 hypothetical protein [Austwickia sp. TVS 96-490-7B]
MSVQALGQDEDTISLRHGRGVLGKIMTVGLVGLLGAVLVGVVAAYELRILSGLSQEQAALNTLQKTAQQLRYGNAEVSGWELGVVGDVYRLGTEKGLTGETAANRNGFIKSRERIKGQLSSFPVGDLVDSEKATFEKVQKLYDAYFAADDAAIQLYQKGDEASRKKADASINGGDAGSAFNALDESTTNLVNSISSRVAAKAEDSQDATNRTTWLLVGTVTVLAAVIIVAARLIASPIRAALVSVRNCLHAMGRGDMTVPAQVTTRDEVGQMAAAAEQTRTSIRALIGELTESSISVAEGSGKVSSVSESIGRDAAHAAEQLTAVSTAADDVSRNVQTVAAGTEEMTASIREISKNTTDAAGVAASAVQVADRTEAAVAAISEIAAIISQINDTQATIASAVEEQTATTNEMSRNVSEAASGAQHIATNVLNAAAQARQSRDAADSLMGSTDELAGQAGQLRSLVNRFTC